MKRVSVAVVTALSLLFVSSGAGLAQDAEKPAVKDGWVEKAFDFSAPDLDFKTLVPEGAVVETRAMGSREDGELGQIDAIGDVQPIQTAKVPIDVTIIGYDLEMPVSAERLCRRMQEVSGYSTRRSNNEFNRAVSHLSAERHEGGRLEGGIFSTCILRGSKALAIHFQFDLSKTKTAEEAAAISIDAAHYAETFTDAMVFKSGRADGYWEGIKDVSLLIAGNTLQVSIPQKWESVVHTFDGRAEGRFAVVGTHGAVWFSTLKMAEKPDLEELGNGMLLFVMQGQNQAFGEVLMTASRAKPHNDPNDPLVHQYRFSVKSWNGDDYGYLHAFVVWHQGVLYVLDYWRPSKKDDLNTYFSVVPVITIYDGLLLALEDFLLTKE